MAVNLLEKVQENLGYPALQKIDPNTQAVAEDDSTPNEHKFSQAAVPAVLTAMYRFGQSDEGALRLIRENNSTNWAEALFTDNSREAIGIIASYAGKPEAHTSNTIDKIAEEAIRVMKEDLPAEPSVMDVKNFINGQRNNILPFLPAALNMGNLLNDNTLDDNTNKMEGPISSLMNSIGNVFSSPVEKNEAKNN